MNDRWADIIHTSQEILWTHQADRTIWELENICMKGKCVICNM